MNSSHSSSSFPQFDFSNYLGVFIPSSSSSFSPPSSSSLSERPRWRLAIHGGAGLIAKHIGDPERNEYRKTLKQSLQAGAAILSSGGSSRAAVIAAIGVMEDSPLFNAGKGSVYNFDGRHEMDASVMDGRDLSAGAVTCISRIKNPIVLADAVRTESPHVFLCGEGAEEFGRTINNKKGENGGEGKIIEFCDPDYFGCEHRKKQWIEAKKLDMDQPMLDHNTEAKTANINSNTFSSSHSHSIASSSAPLSSSSSNPSITSDQPSVDERKFGTVGAVALDINGNLFSGTSTGGMTNKRWNRIGDTPCIGAGTYADNNSAAISCTGYGEYFIRLCVAKEVSNAMIYGGLSLKQSSEIIIKKFKTIHSDFEGGYIAIDYRGNIAMPFNSQGMYRAFITQEENIPNIIDTVQKISRE